MKDCCFDKLVRTLHFWHCDCTEISCTDAISFLVSVDTIPTICLIHQGAIKAQIVNVHNADALLCELETSLGLRSAPAMSSGSYSTAAPSGESDRKAFLERCVPLSECYATIRIY